MTLKKLTLVLTFVCVTWMARSQTNSNGLEVSARASLYTATNTPHLFLTIKLLNTSDHDVTVLTKNLNVGVEPTTNSVVLSLGYGNPLVTYQGHPVIPSLYEFSPVNLRPDEAALVRHEIAAGLDVLRTRNDLPLLISYSVSSEWGERFGVWSGTVKTPPITASIRK